MEAATQEMDTADRFASRRNDWESTFFAKEIWTLAPCPSGGRTVTEWMSDTAGVEIWECRLPIAASPAIEHLFGAGFFASDTSCDFTFDLPHPDSSSEARASVQHTLHVATADEIPDLEAVISEESFATRFCRSPFSPADASRFYRAWVRNAVLGKFDELCCVATSDGRISGLVTLRTVTCVEARIGLIYTVPDARGLGVANTLFVHAAGIARQRGCRLLQMATQMTNQSALSLGARMGGRVRGLYLHMYRLNGPSTR